MPFETTIAQFGEQSVITLKDLSTSTFAEIYSFGALLNSFTAVVDERPLNVIHGHSSLAEAMEHLTPFFHSAKLSPYVCRVKNAKYHFGENDYYLTKYTPRGQALHGLVYDKTFTVAQHSSDNNAASVTLAYEYDNDLEGFPFRYRCEVLYSLAAGNKLTVSSTITNFDEQLMPVTDGWHPYFTLGDPVNECQLEFQSKEMLEFDEELIPTGKLIPYEEFGSLRTFGGTVYDNCFTLNFAECQPMCVLRNPARKVQVEIHPEASYPYLQFYTPDHRKSIAIENISAAPDAFNNGMGLKILSPNEAATFTTAFIIRQL